jgi:hypothetical protein
VLGTTVNNENLPKERPLFNRIMPQMTLTMQVANEVQLRIHSASSSSSDVREGVDCIRCSRLTHTANLTCCRSLSVLGRTVEFNTCAGDRMNWCHVHFLTTRSSHARNLNFKEHRKHFVNITINCNSMREWRWCGEVCRTRSACCARRIVVMAHISTSKAP